MCNFRDLDLSRPELTDRGYLSSWGQPQLSKIGTGGRITRIRASRASLHLLCLCISDFAVECYCCWPGPGPFGFQNRSRQQSHEDLGISCRLRPSPYCPNFRTVWNCSADSDRVQVEGKLFFLIWYRVLMKLHFKIIILHSLLFKWSSLKKVTEKNYQICIDSSPLCSFCMLWITFHRHKIYAKTMEGQALYPRRHPL